MATHFIRGYELVKTPGQKMAISTKKILLPEIRQLWGASAPLVLTATSCLSSTGRMAYDQLAASVVALLPQVEAWLESGIEGPNIH